MAWSPSLFNRVSCASSDPQISSSSHPRATGQTAASSRSARQTTSGPSTAPQITTSGVIVLVTCPWCVRRHEGTFTPASPTTTSAGRSIVHAPGREPLFVIVRPASRSRSTTPVPALRLSTTPLRLLHRRTRRPTAPTPQLLPQPLLRAPATGAAARRRRRPTTISAIRARALVAPPLTS